MQVVYGVTCVDVISTVTHWVWQFKQEVGEASLCDKNWGGQDRIQKLVKHWQECIEAGGDYVESDYAQF